MGVDLFELLWWQLVWVELAEAAS